MKNLNLPQRKLYKYTMFKLISTETDILLYLQKFSIESKSQFSFVVHSCRTRLTLEAGSVRAVAWTFARVASIPRSAARGTTAFYQEPSFANVP